MATTPITVPNQPRLYHPMPPTQPLDSIDDTGPMAWSDWYLTDEADMGESGEQTLIIRALVSYLTELAQERNWQDILIGSDQFFAWMKLEPLVRVSPDVYLLDSPPPRPLPSSWQTWLPGHKPPRLAFEIVSAGNWRKDYQTTPAKYGQLGTEELVIFDPEAALGNFKNYPQRVALQIWRRDHAKKRLQPTYRGPGPARSELLDAWLVVLREGRAFNLGIARDAKGKDLVPSVEQAKLQKHAAWQREQAARQKAEQAKLQEQTAREKAEQAKLQEQAAREKAEQAQLREQKARQLEQAAREKAEQAKLQEQAAREKAEQAKLQEQAAREKAEQAQLREQKARQLEQAAREKAEQAKLQEQAAREKAEYLLAEALAELEKLKSKNMLS